MESDMSGDIDYGEDENESDGQEQNLDLRPEFCRYRDEGCQLAPSCLNCPLPQCVYDGRGGAQHILKLWRAKEMARLFINEGRKVRELAQVFDVSERTVQRALKVALGDSRRPRGVKSE